MPPSVRDFALPSQKRTRMRRMVRQLVLFRVYCSMSQHTRLLRALHAHHGLLTVTSLKASFVTLLTPLSHIQVLVLSFFSDGCHLFEVAGNPHRSGCRVVKEDARVRIAASFSLRRSASPIQPQRWDSETVLQCALNNRNISNYDVEWLFYILCQSGDVEPLDLQTSNKRQPANRNLTVSREQTTGKHARWCKFPL